MFVWWIKWYGHVIRTDEERVEIRVMMMIDSDDGCVWEENERKTKTKVDGQCKCK